MQKNTAKEVADALKNLATPDRAKNSARFFKTDPGQYGHGDRFIGVTVPEIRLVVSKYNALSLKEIEKLLHSPIHEDRLAALLILVSQYKKAKNNEVLQEELVDFYLANIAFINNWDLVDGSAPYILGHYLWEKPKTLLENLANSNNLWERRIAMISCFYFIRQGESKEALQIAQMLLKDPHDLMHKAVGWMLREIGKNCGEKTLKDFLEKNYSKLPRTAFRYAIERFPEKERKAWLKR
ncbi:MAG: DNA alkylation repair protein [Candidatus Gracilibacteria bacterium]|jgi:3-methyladenine DNA glycosylase AlkD